ncbi:MAG: ATP-binding protein [Spirochaetales bacterium]|nr:ATP-binding protein [Spirochaetales bacterium]
MKVAIASGKGGTGKTTLAVNLAAYMSESERVVLADLDVEEPNSSLFLKGEVVHKEAIYTNVPRWEKDACSNCGLCQKVCNFHAILALPAEVMVFPELCHGCYACSELCPKDALPMVARKTGELRQLNVGSFQFVEGRLDVGQEQAVPVINRTLEYLNDEFPELDTTVILDAPPGTACPVVAATREADFVILVTEPTPFGLYDLTLAVDLVRDLSKEIAVVVNRFGIGNDDVFAFCEESSIPVIARIPNDRKIAELYSRGELVYRKVPEVKRELEKIRTLIHEYSRRTVF